MKNHIIDNDLEIVQIVNPTLLVENGHALQIHLKGFITAELAKLIQTITDHGGVTVDNSENAIVLTSAAWYYKKKTAIFHIDWLYDSIKRNKVLDLQKYLLRDILPKKEIKEENDIVKEEDIKWEIDTDLTTNDLEKSKAHEVKCEEPILILSSSDEEGEEIESRQFRPDLKSRSSNHLDRMLIDVSQSDDESPVAEMSDNRSTENLNASFVKVSQSSSDSSIGPIDWLPLSSVLSTNATTPRLNGNWNDTIKITRYSIVINSDTPQSGEKSTKPRDGKENWKADNSDADDLKKSNVDEVEFREPITILGSSDEDGEFKSRKIGPHSKFGWRNNSDRMSSDWQFDEESLEQEVGSNGATETVHTSFIEEALPSFDSTVGGIDSLKLSIISPARATTLGFDENATRSDGRTVESIHSSPLSNISSLSTAWGGLNRDDSTEMSPIDSVIHSDTSQYDEAPMEQNINGADNGRKSENVSTNDTSHSSHRTATSSVEDGNINGLKRRIEELGSSRAPRILGKYSTFTRQEEKAMIHYLIEQKAFFKAGGEVIWQLMIDDGLMNRHKSGAMRHHFENHLKHRIGDYTDDPEIRRIFQLREEALETHRRLRKRRKIVMGLDRSV